MSLSQSNSIDQLGPVVAGFEHINRFWDRRQNRVVAKILPGEFYVSTQDEVIATTLGSCISACIWDDKLGVGGMNHFMLPVTDKAAHHVSWGSTSSATRYGNYAMEHLINEVLKNGGKRINLKAKVFGGGNVVAGMGNVGHNNATFVVEYLSMENIPLISSDLELEYPRKVQFEPKSGRALVKRLKSLHNTTIQTREYSYRREIEQQQNVGGDVELF